MFIVGAILGDWYAFAAFGMKLIVWGICFYLLVVNEVAMENWYDAAWRRAVREDTVGSIEE